MAVYTQINDSECRALLQHYALGELCKFTGISAGVTNSNYQVVTTQGQYVLTIFEALGIDALLFYIELGQHVRSAGLPCARVVQDRQDKTVQIIQQKAALIQTWLTGTSVLLASVRQCELIGDTLARMHSATHTFSQRQRNTRGQAWREDMLKKCGDNVAALAKKHMQQAVKMCANIPWKRLPLGIIHADLFPDNVLFEGGEVSGIFDFYYACYDASLLDVAITVTAWALDETTGKLDHDKANAVLTHYCAKRPFLALEKQYWPQVLVASALRFWLSRLHDLLFSASGKTGDHKDPTPYYQLLLYYLEQSEVLILP